MFKKEFAAGSSQIYETYHSQVFQLFITDTIMDVISTYSFTIIKKYMWNHINEPRKKLLYFSAALKHNHLSKYTGTIWT